MKAGDKVRTTKAYFKKFDRKIYGVVAEFFGTALCIVRVEEQEGKGSLPHLTENRLLMNKKDLVKDDAK